MIRIIRSGIFLIIIIPIFEYVILPEIVSQKKNLSLLQHLNFFLLLIALGLEASALLSYAYLTKSVLPKGAVKVSKILRINTSTLALSHILPGGTAAGTALSYRLLSSEGINTGDVTFALATQGIGSAVVLNVLFWMFLILSIPFHSLNNPLYIVSASVGAGLLAIFALLIFLFTKGKEVSQKVVIAVFRPIPLINEQRVSELFAQIAKRIDEMHKTEGLLPKAILFATCNWLLDASCLWVVLIAFGHVTSPIDLMVAYCLANVLAAIPITPAGLGVIEGVLIPTLRGFGTPSDIAVLGVLTYRLINFWLPIPIGGGTYVSLRIRGKGRKDQLNAPVAT